MVWYLEEIHTVFAVAIALAILIPEDVSILRKTGSGSFAEDKSPSLGPCALFGGMVQLYKKLYMSVITLKQAGLSSEWWSFAQKPSRVEAC